MTEPNQEQTEARTETESTAQSNNNEFRAILDRLQDIANQVQNDDTALETSMDLLNEAVELGTKATQLIDDANLSEEEKQKLQEMLDEEPTHQTTS